MLTSRVTYAGIHGGIVSRYPHRSFGTKEWKTFKIGYQEGFDGNHLCCLCQFQFVNILLLGLKAFETGY